MRSQSELAYCESGAIRRPQPTQLSLKEAWRLDQAVLPAKSSDNVTHSLPASLDGIAMLLKKFE